MDSIGFDAAQEEDQSQVCIQQAGANPHQLAPAEAAGKELEDQKQPGHGEKGYRNLLQVGGEGLYKVPGGPGGGEHVGDDAPPDAQGRRDEEKDHALPHGDHGHIHTQGKQSHAEDQQKGPEQEQDQRARVQGGDGDGQQKDDGGDGENRGHGLLRLFHLLLIEVQWTSPLSIE